MKKFTLILAFASFRSYCTDACTGITLSTTDDDHIQARTLEWGNGDEHSKLVISPRNYEYVSIMPDQKKGLTWKSQYGFVGLSVNQDHIIAEALNEEGLSASKFFFPRYGSLSKYEPGRTENTINDMDFVRWVVTQFKTVQEVTAAMDKIKLVHIYIDENGVPSPTAHWRISDRQGNSVVIEIMNFGEVKIHNNTAKVLTNSPAYDWHVTNLNNYINLHPGSSPPQMYNDVEATSFGVGSSFVGLPGDISPPSRFVRAAFYVNSAPVYSTAEEAVSEAFHILNNFDIPIGSEFTEKSHIVSGLPSATQWTTAVDLSNGFFFYKTMHDSTIKRVALSDADFSVTSERVMKLGNGKFSYEEVDISNKENLRGGLVNDM